MEAVFEAINAPGEEMRAALNDLLVRVRLRSSGPK